jgi:hypothetical protein
MSVTGLNGNRGKIPGFKAHMQTNSEISYLPTDAVEAITAAFDGAVAVNTNISDFSSYSRLRESQDNQWLS